MKDYSKDVKVCKNLIEILEGQIARTDKGEMFLLPGTTPQGNIKVWQQEIEKQQNLIKFLQRGGKNKGKNGGKMKKYVREFEIDANEYTEDKLNAVLESKGATAEDVISITFYHSGPYQSYTIWYRSERRAR